MTLYLLYLDSVVQQQIKTLMSWEYYMNIIMCIPSRVSIFNFMIPLPLRQSYLLHTHTHSASWLLKGALHWRRRWSKAGVPAGWGGAALICSPDMRWHGASLLGLEPCWQVGILLRPTSGVFGVMWKIAMVGGRNRKTQRGREISVKRNACF